MLRASTCKILDDKSQDYRPFWDELAPTAEDEPCEDWKTYISKLKKVGSYAGHIELHAIAKLYDIQIYVLTPGGVCLSIQDEKREHSIYLWHQAKHYELLKGVHPSNWIQDHRALGYTGGRGGGKSVCSSVVHSDEIDSQVFPAKNQTCAFKTPKKPTSSNRSSTASRVRTCEIDSEVFSRKNKDNCNKQYVTNQKSLDAGSLASVKRARGSSSRAHSQYSSDDENEDRMSVTEPQQTTVKVDPASMAKVGDVPFVL